VEKKKRKRLPRPQRRRRPSLKRERSAERKPIVRVDTVKAHPRYKKVVRRSAKFHAHDEQNAAKVGDVVLIVETRPLSKTKSWRLAQVLEVAK
jgi:small subunit ribosomal protein S17